MSWFENEFLQFLNPIKSYAYTMYIVCFEFNSLYSIKKKFIYFFCDYMAFSLIPQYMYGLG